MALQAFAQRATPGEVGNLLSGAWRTKPEGNLCGQISVQVAILLRRQHYQICWLWTLGELHERLGQVVPHRLAVLRDHSSGVQHLTEDIAGKRQQVIGAIVTQGCRSTHTHQLPRRRVKAALEAANQTGQVGPLSTVERV
ncbi:hypothetical protein D9M68_473700 [compost metagenome]